MLAGESQQHAIKLNFANERCEVGGYAPQGKNSRKSAAGTSRPVVALSHVDKILAAMGEHLPIKQSSGASLSDDAARHNRAQRKSESLT
jgi:hypothetical protein